VGIIYDVYDVFNVHEVLKVAEDTYYYVLLWIIVEAIRTEPRPLSILNLYYCSCTSVIILNVYVSMDKYSCDIFNFINHTYQIVLTFVHL
jgi:hypothetical protein